MKTSPVSFDYFVQKAKERIEINPDYASLCLDALALKAKNIKSLDAVHEEMKKMRLDYWTYRFAFEASTPPVLDESPTPIIAPMIKTQNGWFFKGNKAIEKGLIDFGVDISDLPSEFSVHDREQMAQYMNISYYKYCALPFVRIATKKHIFRMLASAENEELLEISPSSYQDKECVDEQFKFKKNNILSIISPLQPSCALEKEQIRQLSGDVVVPLS